MTCSFNVIFKEKKEVPTHITYVLPAGIRFKFYAKREDVKLENKFTGLPLTVPMVSDMASSYSIIKEATKSLKGSMGFVYSIYALSFWTS